MDDARLPAKLLDALFAHSVSSEHVAVLARQEAQACSMPHKSLNAELEQFREPTLRFLSQLSVACRLPETGQFAALELLDMFHARGGGSSQFLESLPAACAAAVTLVGKGEDSSFAATPDQMAAQASSFAKWLRSQGAELSPEVSGEDVIRQELHILVSLEWQWQYPSVHIWLDMLSQRFQILSGNAYRSSIDFAKIRGLTTHWGLLHSRARMDGTSPRRVACGLFCLQLVAARLLPLDALRPARVSEQEWERLLKQGQCLTITGPTGQCQEVLPCSLQPMQRQQVLAWLQLSSGMLESELKELAHSAALTMRTAVEEAREKQLRHGALRRSKENCSTNKGAGTGPRCAAKPEHDTPSPLGDGGKRLNRVRSESGHEANLSGCSTRSPNSGGPESSPESLVLPAFGCDV
jgi:hypothetical protein